LPNVMVFHRFKMYNEDGTNDFCCNGIVTWCVECSSGSTMIPKRVIRIYSITALPRRKCVRFYFIPVKTCPRLTVREWLWVRHTQEDIFG